MLFGVAAFTRVYSFQLSHKIYLFIFITVLSIVNIVAADSKDTTINIGSIRGQILDETTQSPLPAVNIMIEGTQLGTAADADGKYFLDKIPSGIYRVKFMMMGYETRIINNVVVNPGLSTWQIVEMNSTILEADSVIVTAGYFHEARDAIVSNRSVDFEEIRSDPGSLMDIQRVVQALPAVVSGADQDNEIIVRGGMPGENLFLMDDIEIPNPNHFGYQGSGGGPINMINTNFVRRVDFYAGAFPARYGDKASSVMDISLREGNRDRRTGKVYLGMSGAGLSYEGPFANRRGSFMVSAQKSFLDLIISSTGLTAVPQYYSLQGKGVYDLNENNQLLVNAIFGDDEITIEDDESGYARGAENVRSQSHQYAFGATLKSLQGHRGFSKLTVSQTLNHWDQYVYDEFDIPYYTNISTEIERTIKYDATYIPVRKIELNLGGFLKNIDYDIREWAEPDTIYRYNTAFEPPIITNVYQIYDTFQNQNDDYSWKSGLFCQLKWLPHSKLTVTTGVRYDYLKYTKNSAVDPRIGFSYDLFNGTKVNLAFGQHSQFPNYINLTSHPENKNLQYKRTKQVVFGLEKLFTENIRGTMEVFYKDYSNVPISVSSLTPDPFDASYGQLLSQGKGYAKGFELFLQKKLIQNHFFTISYAYSQSKGHDPRF